MTKPQHLRIATYNLQKCIGLDLQRRPERNLDVIDSMGAHVVVLQEADKRLQPRPTALPHDMIQERGWRILPFGASAMSLGWHGNAMLVAPEIEISAIDRIDLPGLEPRGAISTHIDTPIGSIRVVGVHLGLARRSRRAQISALMRWLEGQHSDGTVLAGDFNEWKRGDDLGVSDHGMRFVDSPPSFPAFRPIANLDRFALCSGLAYSASGTNEDLRTRIASDHLPVWVDVFRNSSKAAVSPVGSM